MNRAQRCHTKRVCRKAAKRSAKRQAERRGRQTAKAEPNTGQYRQRGHSKAASKPFTRSLLTLVLDARQKALKAA